MKSDGVSICRRLGVDGWVGHTRTFIKEMAVCVNVCLFVVLNLRYVTNVQM